MAVIRWSEASQAWEPVEGEEMPTGLDGAEVGLYETLMISATAYGLSLHADRVARSWELVTGKPLAATPLPSLAAARDEARRRGWPALRFDVRRFPDGTIVAEIRRRTRIPATPPLPLLVVSFDSADAAYPHKSADRARLTRASAQATAAGAHDALLVVDGEVREAAGAFVGLVTAEGLLLPPLRQHVLPSTTRTATAEWCRDQGRGVQERPIRVDELDGRALVYGSALTGVHPAYVAGQSPLALPGWFDPAAIERRLAE
jgi:branched-subunit amino acid aminotransferase/4-amino-4-deoxychorismate lyase